MEKASNEEIASLMKNQTWQLVPKLDEQKVVDCKWIFKLKEGVMEDEPVW